MGHTRHALRCDQAEEYVALQLLGCTGSCCELGEAGFPVRKQKEAEQARSGSLSAHMRLMIYAACFLDMKAQKNNRLQIEILLAQQEFSS